MRHESKRAWNTRAWADGRMAQGYANQLSRGDQILHQRHHHAGMAVLVGLPRPEGLTLSRTCGSDCPTSYIGYHYQPHRGKQEYRLCNDSSHYNWETFQKNQSRKRGG